VPPANGEDRPWIWPWLITGHPIAGPLMKRFIDALPFGQGEAKSKAKDEA